MRDLTGRKFGKLTVLNRSENIGGASAWLCSCSCGKEKKIREYSLINGGALSCGCRKGVSWKDRIGTKMSGAVIVSRNDVKSNGKTVFNCICECGTFFSRQSLNLLRGGNCRRCAAIKVQNAKKIGNKIRFLDENTIEVDISTKKHPNARTVIDSENSTLIDNEVRWYAREDRGLIYAVRLVDRKIQRLHRLICKAPKDMQVDHISGDTLDNRKLNLRVIERSENQRNMSKSKRNKSGVTGVRWCGKDNVWVAQIGARGKGKRIGSYRNFDDAVKARKKAEIEYGYHPNHGREKLD